MNDKTATGIAHLHLFHEESGEPTEPSSISKVTALATSVAMNPMRDRESTIPMSMAPARPSSMAVARATLTGCLWRVVFLVQVAIADKTAIGKARSTIIDVIQRM